MGTVFGLLETFTGLGLMVGPALGGVLFEVIVCSVTSFSAPTWHYRNLYVIKSVLLANLTVWNWSLQSTAVWLIKLMCSSPKRALNFVNNSTYDLMCNLLQVGGFVTPFAVLGGIMVLAVPVNLYILPKQDGMFGSS